MYRDDADAKRLRIETLEAKLAEQEAGRRARDAEIAELRASLESLGHETGWQKRHPSRPLLVAGALAAVGAAGGVLYASRPTAPAALACELYVARLESCEGDPMVVSAYRQAAVQMREALRTTSLPPEGTASMNSACTQALAALDTTGVCKRKTPAPR